MSVSVNFKGRCGNKIFEYVTARIFSEKNGLNLLTNLSSEIIDTTPHKKFEDDVLYNGRFVLKSDSFYNDEICFNGKNFEYFFDDFFQNTNYINKKIDLVKSFFHIKKIEKNCKDIVIHLRLDDYLHVNNISNPENWDRSEIISPNYYFSILEKESYENLYIVVDKIKYDWEKKYLSYFNHLNPIIISNSPREDFEFIRTFNKIICSNSTFCYWSAFLSEAENIYTFGNVGCYGKNKISHGNHVVNLDNVKNISVSIKEDFYYGN